MPSTQWHLVDALVDYQGMGGKQQKNNGETLRDNVEYNCLLVYVLQTKSERERGKP